MSATNTLPSGAAATPAGALWVRPLPGSSKATWMLSCTDASVKKPGAPMAHGEPTSVGRIGGGSSARLRASAFAPAFVALTSSPSTLAMSRPRPYQWFETWPPVVNCG